MIPERDREALRQRFQQELQQDVTIKLFTQTSPLSIPGRECQYCRQTQTLLEDLVTLSPKLRLEVRDFYSQSQEARELGIARIPAMVMAANGQQNVRFYGIPLGYEFATVLHDLMALSRGDSLLKEETRRQLAQVDQDVHIQVFVTPT